MNLEVVSIYLLAMLAACLSWAIPRQRVLDSMAIFTIGVIGWLSLPTMAWLLAASCLSWAAMRFTKGGANKGVITALCTLLLLGTFTAAQFTSTIAWIGMSFFTLRMLHVLGDWWTGKLTAPPLLQLLRYQLFLPVIVIGPIHRYQNFTRQAERRRWDNSEFLSGLERCLIGFFFAHFMGEVVLARIDAYFANSIETLPPFLESWTFSAIGWVRLFFIFAGLTNVALGASQMMGLKLEENFNKPWRATSLLDFWNRWHMSLTSWSRDYAYRPVMAITRQPLLGLIAAMLVIGLWHDISLYYVFWSFWQTLGIVLSRYAGSVLRPDSWPSLLRYSIVPIGILGWLSASRPVITLVLGIEYDAYSSPF